MRDKESYQRMKAICLIYRFIFILFFIWGISQMIGFSIMNISEEILTFSFVVNILSFLCILYFFIKNIKGKTGRIATNIKNNLTFCAAIIFITNFDKGLSSYWWILGVLLPVMMIIDWFFFSRKGKLNFYEPLLWLFVSLLFIGILSLILIFVYERKDAFNIIGLFNNRTQFIWLVIKGVLIGFLMYFIDCVLGAVHKKRFKNIFAVAYRILFIYLIIYAIINTDGIYLTTYINSMRFYHVFINFLFLVCICVLLIYNIVRANYNNATYNPFPFVKGALTTAGVIIMIINFMYGKSLTQISIAELIYFYLSPVMMILDWILFDQKGEYKAYEPLLWSILPVGYFGILSALKRTTETNIYTLIFGLGSYKIILIWIGIIIFTGYLIYFIDKIFYIIRNKS